MNATAGAILKGVGSIGLSLIFWVIGFLFASGEEYVTCTHLLHAETTSLASLSVYLEYASYFPHRSGAEVAYLERAYPRPRFLARTHFTLKCTITLTLTSASGNLRSSVSVAVVQQQ